MGNLQWHRLFGLALNEVVPELVDDLKPEGRKEVASRSSTEERLEGLPLEEVLKSLSITDLREYLRGLEEERPESN